MRKILLYILCMVFLCFLIPILFTQKKQLKEEKTDNKIEEKIENYNYGQYNRVKLLHTKTEEIEELELDNYLLGVVSSEMPASFEQEALKAQAVVARTYTIYKITGNKKHENADICDNSACCQAWISKEDRLNKWNEGERETNWAKIEEAVNSTKGKIVTYEGKPINAFFHSNSGGITDTATAVWGGNNYPYLQAVITSGEDSYSQYNSEMILTKDEFINKIKKYHNNFKIDFSLENQIEILEYTDGERIKTIKIGNLNLSGVEIRSIFGLKSAKFEINVEGENIKFSVIGYGHGVGMSQTGADSMAKQGSNYEEIIKHFYTGVEITNI
ncbi:MAG: stage II sporulation protein D [Clostridia bacterium]|nr:stage II sporulation protein D [Clostridia bacterium]